MKVAAFLMLLLPCAPAGAEVFKCKSPGGGAIYQSEPCPGGARLEVRDPRAAAPPAPSFAPETREKSQMERDMEQATRWEKERLHRERLRGIDLDIQLHEEAIHNTRARMDQELAYLRAQQATATNTAVGRAWLQSLSRDIQTMTNRYQRDIQTSQNRINELRAEKARLGQ